MGFLADGADNPIFNPPLRITRPALPSSSSSSSSSSSIISRFFRLRLVFACSLFFEKRKEKTREGIESNRRKYGAAWKRPFIRVTRRFLAELSRDLRAVVPFPRRSGPRIMYIYTRVLYARTHAGHVLATKTMATTPRSLAIGGYLQEVKQREIPPRSGAP